MSINSFDSSTIRSGTYRKDSPVALANADGDTQPLITDSSGLLYVNSVSRYSVLNIATNATTTLKTGPGVLHTIVINTKGGGSTATIFDNTTNSGTKIATIDTTLSTTSFTYDAAFTIGLTIVTAASVSAADLTITFL